MVLYHTDASDRSAHAAWLHAAAAGLATDGVLLYKFLVAVSRDMDEAIARDFPGTRRLEYEYGGSRHVPYDKIKEHKSRDSRWDRILKFFGRARKAVGAHDMSYMMGEGVVRSIAPKGHGAEPRRKLVRDVAAFLDALLSNETARERLKLAIAVRERTDDHVALMAERRRLANNTFAAPEQYRDQFLIKYPSRRDLVANDKRLVLSIYADVMAVGPKWISDAAELEAAHQRAREKLPAAINDAERATALYAAFRKEHGEAALAEAKARGLRTKKSWNWMKILAEWWAASPRNPKNAATPADAAAAAEQGEDDVAAQPTGDDAEAEAEQAPEVPEPTPMQTEPPEPTPVEPPPVEPPPPRDPKAEDGSKYFQLGGIVFAEIKILNKSPHNGSNRQRGKQARAAGSGDVAGTQPKPLRACFLLELDKTVNFLSRLHGRYGLCAFAALVERTDEVGGDPVDQMHLLVRYYENEHTAAKGELWPATERARDLYKSLGFEALAGGPQNPSCMHKGYKELCQRYLTVSMETLRARLAALGASSHLDGGAAWIRQETCSYAKVRANDPRPYWELQALDAMIKRHSLANGGDGGEPKGLVPLRHAAKTCIALFAMVPKPAQQPAPEPAPQEDEEAAPDDYEHATAEMGGEQVPIYLDDEPQQTIDDIEGETALDGDGSTCESFGAINANEILQQALKMRLAGEVVLSVRSSRFGAKVTLDAAAVRRAKRGSKNWTTIIMQLLATNLRSDDAWGFDAVIGQLDKAQSPNLCLKLRLWNGKDNRENVSVGSNQPTTRAVSCPTQPRAPLSLPAPRSSSRTSYRSSSRCSGCRRT